MSSSEWLEEASVGAESAQPKRIEVDQITHPLAEMLSERVIGQEAAAQKVASEIAISEAGMQDPTKPRTALLFAGPTGVGKTEMTRAIAKALYGDEWEQHYKRVDCNLLTEKSSTTSLTGSGPRWVGYGDKPLIDPDFLNQQGGTVIAFDEIEKAHPEIRKLLLTVIEEASLTTFIATKPQQEQSNQHATVTNLPFDNSILIFTSNAGSEGMQKARTGKGTMGFPGVSKRDQDIKEEARRGLKEAFSEIPEFLGRIGERRIIVFDELQPHHYGQIFDTMIGEINERITGAIEISDTLKDSIVEEALKAGEYGARDLRDTIHDRLISPLAYLRAAGQIGTNTEAIIDIEDGKVVFYEGKVIDEPEEPEEQSVGPHVPQTLAEFQYGQPFNFQLEDVELGKAVNGLVHEVVLLNQEYIVGKAKIFEARIKELDEGVPFFLSEDARPYRIAIELNRVPRNFRTSVTMQLEEKVLSGNLTTVRSEGKYNDILVASWRDPAGSGAPLTPILSEVDLRDLKFVIRK